MVEGEVDAEKDIDEDSMNTRYNNLPNVVIGIIAVGYRDQVSAVGIVVSKHILKKKI